MIEILFLGTGAALPMPGGSNSAYFVRLGSENLLIDAGPAILQQLDAAGISPREISHIFFTHRHGDHVLGFPMLMMWYLLNPSASIQTPVLIGSGPTLDALEALFLHVYGPDVAEIIGSAPRMVLPEDGPGQARIHPHIMLRTLPMNHADFAPVLGLRIDTRGERLGAHSLAFTSDTAPCDNIVALAKGADVLVHEANWSADLDPQLIGTAGHSTAQEAGRHAAAAGVGRLALTHISNRYAGRESALREEARREFTGPVSAPLSGTTLQI
jgi:ribonuclease BN (tRNA processing enzyme)